MNFYIIGGIIAISCFIFYQFLKIKFKKNKTTNKNDQNQLELLEKAFINWLEKKNYNPEEFREFNDTEKRKIFKIFMSEITGSGKPVLPNLKFEIAKTDFNKIKEKDLKKILSDKSVDIS